MLLLSLAFLATGEFLLLHAVGTTGILFIEERAGFHVRSRWVCWSPRCSGTASAFVDLRPRLRAVRGAAPTRCCGAVVVGRWLVWFAWTVLRLPGAGRPRPARAPRGSSLAVLAGVGFVLYVAAALRYLVVFRDGMSLLPASVVACFVLLAEAMVGVATTGERSWHASWWEWHGLIVLAFLVVFFAARREWRDERFRTLYLSTTRERTQDVSVLFCDLAGYTTSRSAAAGQSQAADMLAAYYSVAAPLVSKQFGGEVEKFVGDGIIATFNTRGDQPDHALRAAGAALALQRELTRSPTRHEGWPRVRVGVNSGRGRGARARRQRVRRLRRRRRHHEPGVAAGEPRAGGRGADRQRDLRAAARRHRRRAAEAAAGEGPHRAGRGLRAARGAGARAGSR